MKEIITTLAMLAISLIIPAIMLFTFFDNLTRSEEALLSIAIIIVGTSSYSLLEKGWVYLQNNWDYLKPKPTRKVAKAPAV